MKDQLRPVSRQYYASIAPVSCQYRPLDRQQHVSPETEIGNMARHMFLIENMATFLLTLQHSAVLQSCLICICSQKIPIPHYSIIRTFLQSTLTLQKAYLNMSK